LSTDSLTAKEVDAAVNGLASRLGDRVVGRHDPRWEEARRAWNLAVDQRPAAVAIPESPQDVVAVVEGARQHGLRGGAAGHWAQRHTASLAGGKRAHRHVAHEGRGDRSWSPTGAHRGGSAVAAHHRACRGARARRAVGLGARRVRDGVRARRRRELDDSPLRVRREQHSGRRARYGGAPAQPRDALRSVVDIRASTARRAPD
jgi:hypothetical protein